MEELIVKEIEEAKGEQEERQIQVPNIKKSKKIGIIRQIARAKHEGTNYIILPAERFDKEAKKWLKEEGYKLQPLPFAKKILIEWEYEETCRPGYGKVYMFNGRV